MADSTTPIQTTLPTPFARGSRMCSIRHHSYRGVRYEPNQYYDADPKDVETLVANQMSHPVAAPEQLPTG